MAPAPVYTTEFEVLRDTDTMADATRKMLANRVSDLPVIDATGRFVGMFKLQAVLGHLLPKAALIGLPDLTFVSDTTHELRRRMAHIEHQPVRDFVVRPEHMITPDTSPSEVVLLLYRGTNNLPVVEPGTERLIGMVSARDVLTSIQAASR